MEQESFKDMTFKIILDIKYQFYVIIFLIFTLIFKIIFTQQYLRLTNYLYKILPKFIDDILSISIYEVKAIQLFLIVIAICSFCVAITIKIILWRIEIDKDKKMDSVGYGNIYRTIRLFEKWAMTCINGIVIITIFGVLNDFQEIYGLMNNVFFCVILAIYFLQFYFFLKAD